MYLGDIELARQLKEEVCFLNIQGISLENINTHKRSISSQEESNLRSQTQSNQG